MKPVWFALLLIGVTSMASETLYQQYCAQCHGRDRAGGMGPALLPPNLSRLKPSQAFEVIKYGRTATQMPAFSKTLSDSHIKSLVSYIYSTPASMPRWGAKEITQSHRLLTQPNPTNNQPVFRADPQNLFVVVESGDHHVTILDGDKFEPIARIPTHFALHGGPKFTRDGRFVYFASRDGWISKFDLYQLKYVAEIRAGINTRNLAISDDGRYVAVANYWPHNLVILDGRDLSLERILPTVSQQGKSSRISAVYHARPRHSFVLALKDVPEVWEVPYDPNAKAPFTGLVHDYNPESGEPIVSGSGQFVPIKITLDRIVDDFFFTQDYRWLIGATRPNGSGKAKKTNALGVVINLDVRRAVKQLPLPGMPHLGSGITWTYQGRRVLATPNLGASAISIIDVSNWRVIKTIETLGPGFFIRSHENTPYAWADVFFGPHKNKIHIIDKRTLNIVKTLAFDPGKTVAHVEFTKDGRYALVSVMEPDGAIIVVDAKTFKTIKRIPMKRPVGKYNVYNKTHLSEGTSH